MTLVTDIDRVRNVFNKYCTVASTDTTNGTNIDTAIDNSFLTTQQYKVAALAISGYKPTKAMVERLYRDLDIPSGRMGQNTFIRIQLEQAKLRSVTETLKQIFQAFDWSCNGFISRKDFVRAMGEVMPSYSNAEGLFDKADWDQDGRVSWRDFTSIMGMS